MENSISIETRDQIHDAILKNGFKWMNGGRGSQNPNEWRGFIYHWQSDNAWACLTQRANIVLKLNHYDNNIEGVECKVNKALRGSVHGEYVHHFHDRVGVSLNCLNVQAAKEAIEQYSMK